MAKKKKEFVATVNYDFYKGKAPPFLQFMKENSPDWIIPSIYRSQLKLGTKEPLFIYVLLWTLKNSGHIIGSFYDIDNPWIRISMPFHGWSIKTEKNNTIKLIRVYLRSNKISGFVPKIAYFDRMSEYYKPYLVTSFKK